MRKAPGQRRNTSEQPETLADSGYTAALALLGNLPKSRAALHTAIAQPSLENRQRANKAINENLALTATLTDRTGQLAKKLGGTTASAFPMIWHARACDFLLPGQSTWWNNNDWTTSLFYQFGSPLKAAPPTLTVNAAGKFRLVVIAGGPSLPAQSQHIQSVASFLEGINAAPSRNGKALVPDPNFSGQAPAPNFNDRLAY